MAIQFFGKVDGDLNLWVIPEYHHVSIEANRAGRRVRARIDRWCEGESEVESLAAEVAALFVEGGIDAVDEAFDVIAPLDKGEEVIFMIRSSDPKEHVLKW